MKFKCVNCGNHTIDTFKKLYSTKNKPAVCASCGTIQFPNRLINSIFFGLLSIPLSILLFMALILVSFKYLLVFILAFIVGELARLVFIPLTKIDNN